MHRKHLLLIVTFAFALTTLTVAARASARSSDSVPTQAWIEAEYVASMPEIATKSSARKVAVVMVGGNAAAAMLAKRANSGRLVPSGYNCLSAAMTYTARHVFDGKRVTFTVVQTTADGSRND